MKKWTALLLALLLLPVWTPPAEASPDDATVWYASSGSAADGFLNSAVLWNRSVCCFVEGAEERLIVYDLETRQSRTLSLTDAMGRLEYPEGFDPETDDPETLEESLTALIEFWFVWDGRLLAVVTEYQQDSDIPAGGRLAELSLEGGIPAWVGESGLPRLDWTVMIEENGEAIGSRAVEGAYCVGDRLCVQTWDDEGESLLCLFSLRDGKSESVSMKGLLASAPGPEGKIVLIREQGEEKVCVLLNPDTGAEEMLSSAALTGMTPGNLCWSETNRTLYFTGLGEILAAPEGDLTLAAAVNDCPVSGDSATAAVTEEGWMLLKDSRSAVLRDTDPAKRQEVSLTVRDYVGLDAVDRANYAFAALRGDVSVIVDRDSPRDQLLQGMLNRDDTADILCLDISLPDYTALLKRGYIASLAGSEKLNARVETMYPAVAAAVRKDGVLMALPVQAWGYTLGLHPKAMEKAGWTEADYPRTWMAFFDWLAELPARLEGSGVRAFPARVTVGMLKRTLLQTILNQWHSAGLSERFNAPELREVLARLDEVDYAALGVEETAADAGDRDGTPLMETGVSMTTEGHASGYEPLLLSFREGTDARASYHMAVAFLNPYTSHPTEAIAFLECLGEQTDTASAYTFSPEKNEPVRTPDYAQSRQSLADSLEAARAQAKAAKGEDDRASWESIVVSMEKSLKQMEETWWEISPAVLAAFQARAPFLTPMAWDISLIVTESGDASLSEAMDRFRQGEGTAVALLEELDRVDRMRQAEEN